MGAVECTHVEEVGARVNGSLDQLEGLLIRESVEEKEKGREGGSDKRRRGQIKGREGGGEDGSRRRAGRDRVKERQEIARECEVGSGEEGVEEKRREALESSGRREACVDHE